MSASICLTSLSDDFNDKLQGIQIEILIASTAPISNLNLKRKTFIFFVNL